MRPFEWVLAALALGGSVALMARPRSLWIPWGFVSAALVLLAFHQRNEGMHWQLIPLYIALVLIAFFLFRHAGSPFVTGMVAVLLVAASLALSWALPMFHLPKPTGPYAVGVRTIHFVDGSRARELVTEIWYPAEAKGRLAHYANASELAPKHRYMAQIRTNSHEDAPLAERGGAFPLVIFGHRWGGERTQDTFLAEDLASHGYVVASIDHPGNTSRVELENGEVVKGTMARAIDMGLGTTGVLANWNAEQIVWVQDDRFVINTLSQLDGQQGSWLSGRLDLQRIAAVGHSFGGAVSLRLLGLDPRVKCAVNLDGWTFGGLTDRTTQPVMILYEAPPATLEPHPEVPPQSDSVDDQLERYDRTTVDENLQKYGGYKVYVQGTQHLDFTDETLFSPLHRLTYTGPIAGTRIREITRAMVLGFLDQTLKGKGTVPDYPELRWMSRGPGVR